MAGSPGFKVYNPAGEYIAACKHAEDAAALVALNGNGSTIRHGHRAVLWTEGKEDQPASESYDHVAARVHERIRERHEQREAAKRDRSFANSEGRRHVATLVLRPTPSKEG